MATKPVVKTQSKPKTKKDQDEYIWSVGRRRTAVARARLYLKKGKEDNVEIMVNDKPIGQYFHNPTAKLEYAQPLKLTKTLDRFSITIKVKGSGLESQLDAVKHAIARALLKVDEEFRPVLKANGLLTRDSPHDRHWW